MIIRIFNSATFFGSDVIIGDFMPGMRMLVVTCVRDPVLLSDSKVRSIPGTSHSNGAKVPVH